MWAFQANFTSFYYVYISYMLENYSLKIIISKYFLNLQVILFHLPLLVTVEIFLLGYLHELLRIFFLSLNFFPVIFDTYFT